MGNIVDNVESKLKEYNIKVFTNYPVELQHVFMCEGMIIFVDKEDNNIAVAFFAGTRPEQAANNVIILTELRIPIFIMESFAYDDNKQFVSGEKAFELFHKSIVSRNTTCIKDKYTEYLEKANCFSC